MKRNYKIPYGITLIEVLVSLALFSIISAVCIKLVANLSSGYNRLQLASKEQRDISETFRVLDGDFNRNNYRKKKDFLENIVVKSNLLIFPNGDRWEVKNQNLVRLSPSNSRNNENIMMSDVKKLELKIWDNNSFIEFKEKIFEDQSTYLGFEVKIYMISALSFKRLIIVKCLP